MLTSEFHFQFIFYTVVLQQNVVDDVSVKQHTVHVLYIVYITTSSHLVFCALRLKISSGYVDWTALRSSDNLWNIFGTILYHIYDTTEMTASVGTYLQFENIHITLVTEINTRIVDMARSKSSLCMYTSPSMPRYVVLAHIITVIM